MGNDAWIYRCSWESDPAHVAQVREFVTEGLHDHGLGHLAYDVRLVVSELATNAVLHGRTPFTVTLERNDGMVTVHVTDQSDESPRPSVPAELPVSGMGLFVVGHTSHDWGVRPLPGGGKSVWASFRVDD